MHSHGSRDASQLHKSCEITNYAKHSLMKKGFQIWNGLTKDFKNVKLHFLHLSFDAEHIIYIDT